MNDRPVPEARFVPEIDELRRSLASAEERFRIFRELTSDFVYISHVRADGSFENEWLSESFHRVFGRDVETLRAIGWRELSHPDDHHLIRRRVKDLVRGRLFHGVVRVYDIEGEMRFLEDRARPVTDPETGRVTRIYGVARDITTEERARQSLRESESTHRRLVEASPVPIAVHCDERIVFANRAAADVFGAESADDLIGVSIWDRVHPDDHEIARDRVEQIYGKKRDASLRTGRFLRLDGRVIEVELVANRIDFRGRPAAEVIFQDVTERNHMLRDREALATRVVRAQKMESLGALAAGIAHDFNNVLVGLLGHADLALDSLPEDSPARRHLDEIGHGAQHAADLVQQLLDYSGEKRLETRRLDLSALVAEMRELLVVSVKKKAAVAFDLAPDLPVIEGDPTQLKQVLMNLVMNAAEALESPAGESSTDESSAEVRVRTGVESGPARFDESFLVDPRGLRVVLSVSDDGCGMDEWTRRHLFEPFYTTKPDGRGLGMATVLGIVRGHRGALRLESEPGAGTTLEILLPAPPR